MWLGVCKGGFKWSIIKTNDLCDSWVIKKKGEGGVRQSNKSQHVQMQWKIGESAIINEKQHFLHNDNLDDNMQFNVQYDLSADDWL